MHATCAAVSCRPDRIRGSAPYVISSEITSLDPCSAAQCRAQPSWPPTCRTKGGLPTHDGGGALGSVRWSALMAANLPHVAPMVGLPNHDGGMGGQWDVWCPHGPPAAHRALRARGARLGSPRGVGGSEQMLHPPALRMLISSR